MAKNRRIIDESDEEEMTEEEEFEMGCVLLNPELADATGEDREEEMENLFESLESLGD